MAVEPDSEENAGFTHGETMIQVDCLSLKLTHSDKKRESRLPEITGQY